MAEKKADTAVMEFRGGEYEVSVKAIRSMRVQKAMAMAGEDVQSYWRAMDAICCGRLDEYIERIPGEDGNVDEYGASVDDMAEFFTAVAEKYGKN